MTNSVDLIAITDVVRTYATAMTAGDRAELERIPGARGGHAVYPGKARARALRHP